MSFSEEALPADYLPKINIRRPIEESAEEILELLDPNIDVIRWFDEALCVGMDQNIFYPERGESPKQAKETCAVCPVKLHCGLEAMENNEKHGIWGGLSERERRRIRRQRKEQREYHENPLSFFNYLSTVSAEKFPKHFPEKDAS